MKTMKNLKSYTQLNEGEFSETPKFKTTPFMEVANMIQFINTHIKDKNLIVYESGEHEWKVEYADKLIKSNKIWPDIESLDKWTTEIFKKIEEFYNANKKIISGK